MFQIDDFDPSADPVIDSTTLSADDRSNGDMNFTGMEFDITDFIDVVEPIQEDSFNAALSETVLDDQGIIYTIIERGSQQGHPILVSNLGYTYSVKVHVS